MSGSAKRDRFLRVMTAGQVVTDKLVTIRTTKVNDALGLLVAEAVRLEALGLDAQALRDEHVRLTGLRDTALLATGNKAQAVALDPVKDSARDAAKQGKAIADQDIADLRDAIRDNADAATADADAAKLTIDGFGNAAAKQVALKDYAKLAARLGTAKTLPEGAAKRDALAALAAEAATLKAEVAGWDASVGNYETAVGDRKTTTKNWIAAMEVGLARTDLEAKITGIEASLATLGTAADRQAVEALLLKANDDTMAALVKATDAVLSASLKNAKTWNDWSRKIAASNPFVTEYAAIMAAEPTAQAETDLAAKQNALATLCSRTADLQNAAIEIYTAKPPLEKQAFALQVRLARVVPPPTAELAERTTLAARITTSFSAASSMADLKSRYDALKAGFALLAVKVEAAEATRVNLPAMKREVATTLGKAAVTVENLADGDLKTELARDLAALRGRETVAGTMTEIPAARLELLRLSREGLKLLERTASAACKELLAAPDGKAKLDKAIADLGAKTSNPQDDALCRAALSARFGVTFEVPEGLKTERLPQMYALFAKVPESHVGHDKLKVLEYGTEEKSKGNYYQGATAKIALSDMPESDQAYTFQADDGTEQTGTYYNATTLHEIGHAVDAKLGVMATRMGGTGFGKWQVETLAKAAKAHADGGFVAAFTGTGKTPTAADLTTLLETLLEKGDCPKPASATATLGSLFADWNAIMAHKTVAACKAIREPAAPWYKGPAEIAELAVGGRVYQEAYPDNWYSYELAERASTGISRYQWRAPAEWFAEIYALFYVKGTEPPASVAAFVKPPAPVTA